MRSLMMLEEFWCLRSFGRHDALSHDAGGMLGVTARSLMMFEEIFWRHGAPPHDL